MTGASALREWGMIGTLLVATAPLAYAFQSVDDDSAPIDPDTVLFSAERFIRESADTALLAEGNVRAFFGSQSLIADRVRYDPGADIVVAEGNVTIRDESGQAYFADRVELTGDLKDGVVSNFSSLIGRTGRVAGTTAVRRSSGENDLNQAAYTACGVCTDDGDKKRPTWSVEASKITQDTEEQAIRFRHARINVLGVPVFYSPYLEMPDPSVERKSGFLTPSASYSSRLGFEFQAPYYWSISPHQDVTFAPTVFSRLGVLWQGEYRARGYDSGMVVQAGFIDPREDPVLERQRELLEQGELSPDELDESLLDPRWHIFAETFKEFDDGWRLDLDVDVVSDRRYLRTYDVSPEGELQEEITGVQSNRLDSILSFTNTGENRRTDISGIVFQSLRENDDNDFMANALPWIRHEQRFAVPRIGGEARWNTDFLSLHRVKGLDSTRLSTGMSYERQHITQNGHRLRGFAEARLDHYRYQDADEGIQACNFEDGTFNPTNPNTDNCAEELPRGALEEEFSTTRFLPTIGAEWSFPVAKFNENSTIVLEPQVLVAVSPEEDFTDDVFNEDSQFFQFDETTLFDDSKSTGLDIWEDGTRINAGLRGRVSYNNGLNIDGMVGQQFRFEESTAFDEDAGIGDTASDYVATLDVSYGRSWSLENSVRIDREDGTFRRQETSLRGRYRGLSGSASYLRVDTQELGVDGRRDEFLSAAASYRFSDRWQLGLSTRENLESGESTLQNVILAYRDECTIFSLNYRFDNADGDDDDDNPDEFEDDISITFNVEIIGF